MTQIAVGDIGGTHARFALAQLGDGGSVALDEPFVAKVADHATIADAWRAFVVASGASRPRGVALAVAGPVDADIVRFTNSAWAIDRRTLMEDLGVDRALVLNDFGAVAHAVAAAPADGLLHVLGQDRALPERGVVTVLGPGTGLGVAQVLRVPGSYHVVASEGGHMGFAPSDAWEDGLLADLRERLGRVSAERLVAGPGLKVIHDALAGPAGDGKDWSDRAIWAAALTGEDALSEAALRHYCAILGTVAGDLALAHGADCVVLAGSLAGRIRHLLGDGGGFAARFVAKGRFAKRMRDIPVRLLTHPQAGLLGAAVAYAGAISRE